jgi:hypothetical protein
MLFMRCVGMDLDITYCAMREICLLGKRDTYHSIGGHKMKLAVIIVIVIGTICLNAVSADLNMWSFNGFDSYTEYLKMRRLHKYHGTDHSINDGDGEWYYYRNGRKCFLWDPETHYGQ